MTDSDWMEGHKDRFRITDNLALSLEWALRNMEAYQFTGDEKNLREYRDVATAFIEAHGRALYRRALAERFAVAPAPSEPATPPAAVEDMPTLPTLVGFRGLHPETLALVMRFAYALACKLSAAETKYGYSDGWLRDDWMDECRAKLAEHVIKGDPRDVAAYCMFLWHHEESTTPSPQVAGGGDTLRQLLEEAPRAAELATRLVASGPKASHVSCSETHEIADFVHAAIAALAGKGDRP